MDKLKILIVDDDPKVSSLVNLLLTQRGFAAREENRSAVALLTAREYLPDVIILDVNMPGKDGGDVASELRVDPVLKNVPIMFLTAVVSSTDVAASDGILYVAKPAEANRLVTAIQTLLLRPTAV